MSTADDAIRSRHFESGFSEKWSQETISKTKNNLNQVYATNNHKKIITVRDDGKRQLIIKGEWNSEMDTNTRIFGKRLIQKQR